MCRRIIFQLLSCGFLLLLMQGGVDCYGQAKLVKTQGSNRFNNIYCGLEDKEGNLWFGTSGEGVYRYDGKLFTQFTVKDGLQSNAVFCVFQDNSGNLWFGTSEGLCRYDKGAIIPVTIPESFMAATAGAAGDNDSYYTAKSKRNTVWSMFQDRKRTIWIGTGSGVYRYDGRKFNGFLEDRTVVNKANLHLSMIDRILEDKNGVMWFASGMPPGEEGICSYDGKNLVNFKPKNEGWFRTIIEDNNRNLLFATRSHGVLACDISGGKGNVTMASFTQAPQPAALVNGSLTTILKDRAGNIWMASDYVNDIGDTLGGAWCYKQAAEKTFTKISTKEVFFMLEDKAGNIWLGTRNTGLYRYDGKKLENFSE